MPKVPIALAGESVLTGLNSPSFHGAEPDDGFAGRGGQAVGEGIADLGRGLYQYAQAQQGIKDMQDRQIEASAIVAKRQKAQDESMEVAEKYSQLTTDWSKRMVDYQSSPSEDQLSVSTTEYDKYVKGMLEGASSPMVMRELKLKAAGYRLEFVDANFRLQSQIRAQKFGASLDKMMVNADDAIFTTKSIGELMRQKSIINTLIDDAVKNGRIRDPNTVENLKNKVDQLSVSWAEANMGINPQMVKDVIEGKNDTQEIMKGVSTHTKQILIDRANNTMEQLGKMDKLSLQQSLESDIVQRTQTGKGDSLNLDSYEKAFGKTARDIAQRQLELSTQLHSIVEQSKGADGETLDKLLVSSQPKADPKSSTFHDQQEFYEAVVKTVEKAKAFKAKDPFNYFMQQATVKSVLSSLPASQANDVEKAKLIQNIVLEAQKADSDLQTWEYAVMPKDEAKEFILKFNSSVAVGSKQDGGGFREELVQFNQRFGNYTSTALNQIARETGGKEIVSKVNPLLWHVDNPSIFRATLEAIRKDPETELKRFPTSKDRSSFFEDVSMDNNLSKYEMSIFSSNTGAEASKLVSGVRDTFTAFSRDYVLNGGKMKDASEAFFGNYSFGSMNGMPYARPRSYSDETGKQSFMSDKQIELSDKFLEVYPFKIDPSTIDPQTIVAQTKYFTSKQLTEDISDALRRNTFWSTTEDETGVYLYTKGSLIGAPRQVFRKDGTPVKLDFRDTMIPTATLGFGETPGRGEEIPMTDDTWVDHLMRGLQRTAD